MKNSPEKIWGILVKNKKEWFLMNKIIFVIGLFILSAIPAFANTDWNGGIGADVDIVKIDKVTFSAEGRYVPETGDGTIFGVAKLDLTGLWGGASA